MSRREPVWTEDHPKTLLRVVKRSLRKDGVLVSLRRIVPYIRRTWLKS